MSKKSAQKFLKDAFADQTIRQDVFKLIQDLDAQGILDYAKAKGYKFNFVELIDAYKEWRSKAPKPDLKTIKRYIKEIKSGAGGNTDALYIENNYLMPPYLTLPDSDADYLIEAHTDYV